MCACLDFWLLRFLMETPMILIADLTENNANVFYELALRHALGKPAILIIQKEER